MQIGLKIPTLDEFLDNIMKYDLIPVIEVKAVNNDDDLKNLVNDLVNRNNIPVAAYMVDNRLKADTLISYGIEEITTNMLVL